MLNLLSNAVKFTQKTPLALIELATSWAKLTGASDLQTVRREARL
ncbi:hypothetical protein [Deinococcus hohokamensis]|uniref:Uncharacterized protein n=1 Tax=Deinococcus hohokamensis TaxID=309883 RepID=A0ABV9IEX8_9DEIO